MRATRASYPNRAMEAEWVQRVGISRSVVKKVMTKRQKQFPSIVFHPFPFFSNLCNGANVRGIGAIR